MRVALYARVSTVEKDPRRRQGQSPAMQIREMIEFCRRRKWGSPEVFTDAGVSGSKLSRPELDRMLQLCRRRRFDVVIVYRFDRFARSTKQLVDALDEFNRLGIQFVSLHENVDTTLPQGRLIFHIMAAIAEFERELIRERVISGLALARAQGTRSGKPIGRPRLSADVARIRALRAQAWPWEAIAREMGISVRSCRRAFLSVAKPLSDSIQ